METPALDSERQRILALLAQGCTNKQIARSLYLAEATVAHRLAELMASLTAKNRTHLLYRAIETGLIVMPTQNTSTRTRCPHVHGACCAAIWGVAAS